MEINTFLNAEMTTNNLNKIMRTNIKLNSKILSKNTSEIVNTCIGKLYKQMPLAFQNGLQQTKTATANKFVNQGPLERLTKQEWQGQRSTFIKPLKSKCPIYETQILNNLMTINKKQANLTPRRFLRAPNYKIYNSKRYCSSASSSNGSIFYGKENKQRNARAYHMQATNNLENVVLKRSPVMELNTASTRNQRMCPSADTVQRAMKVSGRIQKDLIAIDKILKKRLEVSGKEQDIKSRDSLMPTIKIKPKMANKDFKEDYNKKQLSLKEVELSNKHKSLNLASEWISSQANKNKTLFNENSLKHLKAQEYWFGKALESNEASNALKVVPDKENRIKTNLRKNVRSVKKQVGMTDPMTYIELLAKSCHNQEDSNEVNKFLKANSRAAPSATYSLLKPKGFCERRC